MARRQARLSGTISTDRPEDCLRGNDEHSVLQAYFSVHFLKIAEELENSEPLSETDKMSRENF